MRKFLMAMTCYGSYVDTFLDFSWPSLLADGNVPELKKHYDVIINIHTDEAGRERFKDFPANIICDVDSSEKYGMLARHQHQDLLTAKELGADYHLLMPDFIYSDNCFAGVIKAAARGHTAIARLTLSTVQETIAHELHRPRTAIDLASLGLKHIHPRVKHWVAIKDGFYPNMHILAWHSGNHLRMCSPHMTPVFIANQVINIQQTSLCIDSVLDLVIDGAIYCPQPEDGIVMIEISPLLSAIHAHQRVHLNEFIRILKHNTWQSIEQQSLFLQETVDEINFDGEWKDVEIFNQKSILRNALGMSE